MVVDAELIAPAGLHIWEWFWDLNRLRPMNFGASPIAAGEMLAWEKMLGIVVRPSEWNIIRDMDAAYLSALSSESPTARPRGDGLAITGHEQSVTPVAFDAVFG